MNQKVLVTYASRAGSTAEVAQVIAEELTNRGFVVDVCPVKQVGGLNGYSAVVIGSAVRFGQWLPEAVKFVEKNLAVLSQLPMAAFTMYLINQGEDAANTAAREAYLAPVRKLLKPQHEAYFTGVGDVAKVSFFEGLIIKLVKPPEGDFRDWAAIRSWAQEILA